MKFLNNGVGYVDYDGEDPSLLGKAICDKALDSLRKSLNGKEYPEESVQSKNLSLAILFATPPSNIYQEIPDKDDFEKRQEEMGAFFQKFLDGIQTKLNPPGFGNPTPLVGCSVCMALSPNHYSENGAVLSILSSPYIDKVAISIGENAHFDPDSITERAVKDLLPSGSPNSRNETRDGFILSFFPGFRMKKENGAIKRLYNDYRIHRKILETQKFLYPVFGGAAEDSYKEEIGFQFANEKVYSSSLVLAFVPTLLKFDSKLSLGLEETDMKLMIKGVTDEGKTIMAFEDRDEKPFEIITDIMKKQNVPEVNFVVKNPLGERFYIPIIIDKEKEIVSSVFNLEKGTTLTVMNPEKIGKSEIIDPLYRSLLSSNNISKVGFALVLPCSGRTKFLVHRNEDIQKIVNEYCQNIHFPFIGGGVAGESGTSSVRKFEYTGFSFNVLIIADELRERALYNLRHEKSVNLISSLVASQNESELVEIYLKGFVEDMHFDGAGFLLFDEINKSVKHGFKKGLLQNIEISNLEKDIVSLLWNKKEITFSSEDMEKFDIKDSSIKEMIYWTIESKKSANDIENPAGALILCSNTKGQLFNENKTPHSQISTILSSINDVIGRRISDLRFKDIDMKISEALNRAQVDNGLETNLDELVKACHNLLGFDNCYIRIRDKYEQYLEIIAGKGKLTDFLKKYKLSISKDALGGSNYVCKNKEPLIRNENYAEMKETLNLKEAFRDKKEVLEEIDKIKSCAAFPIINRVGKIIGAILFDSYHEGFFTTSIQRILERLAECLASFIETLLSVENMKGLKAKNENVSKTMGEVTKNLAIAGFNEAIEHLAEKAIEIFNCENAVIFTRVGDSLRIATSYPKETRHLKHSWNLKDIKKDKSGLTLRIASSKEIFRKGGNELRQEPSCIDHSGRADWLPSKYSFSIMGSSLRDAADDIIGAIILHNKKNELDQANDGVYFDNEDEQLFGIFLHSAQEIFLANDIMERIRFLHQNAENLLKNMGRRDFFEPLIHSLGKWIDCEIVSFFIYDPLKEIFILAAEYGWKSPENMVGRAFYEKYEGLTGNCALLKNVVDLVDIAVDPRRTGKYAHYMYPDFDRTKETFEYIAIPLYGDSGPLGIITAHNRKPLEKRNVSIYTKSQISILESIGRQISLYMEHLIILERAKKREAYLNLLKTGWNILTRREDALERKLVNILNLLCSHLSTESGIILLADGKNTLSVIAKRGFSEDADTDSIDMDKGVIGRAFQRGCMEKYKDYLASQIAGELAPLGLQDIDKVCSAAVMPIIFGRDKHGVIVLVNKEIPTIFPYKDIPGEEIDTIGMISYQIGSVITIEKMNKHSRFLLEQSAQERMTNFGVAVAQIAHDINRYLMIVTSTSENITYIEDNRELLKEKLEKIRKNAFKTGDLINNIVNKEKLIKTPQTIILTEILSNAIQNKMSEINASQINYKTDIHDNRRVKGTILECKELFDNLISNAIETMETSEKRLLDISINPDPSKENYTQVVIEDSGAGIPNDIIRKFPDPLYTTKEPPHLGLGLSRVYKIISDFGGHINIENKSEGGLRVILSFPVWEEPK